MRKSSLLGHTAELLESVLATEQPADSTVREFYRKRHYLGSRDRRYVSELLFGILRNYRLLEIIARRSLPAGFALRTSRVPSIALCATYALRLLRENPRDLLPDINGLWRAALYDIDCLKFLEGVVSADPFEGVGDDAAKRISVEHSMPDSIVKEWVERYGVRGTGELCRALNQSAPTTIRVNTLKCSVEQCRSELLKEGVSARPTTFSPVGLVLERRINALALPSFRQGFFELQDEGSQLIALLLDPRSGDLVVDACAGGGGKTLHLAAMMMNRGEVVALDVDELRLKNLTERSRRAGVTIVRSIVITRGAGAPANLEGRADAVLVDAPCSGVGTFRRNPAAKLTFTRDLVAAISRRQKDLLAAYAGLVKPGGRLVYSTCTLLRQENEDTVEEFVSKHPDYSFASAPDLLRARGVQVPGERPFLTLLPHETSTDGFFAAVLMRH